MKGIITHIIHRAGKVWLTLLAVLLSDMAFSQSNPTDSIPDDPAAIKVFNTQALSFGAFSNNGAGGTIPFPHRASAQ